MVWAWACIVAPVVWAATPPDNEQGGRVAPTPQTVGSQELAKSAVVTRIASDITVDGVLDDEVW